MSKLFDKEDVLGNIRKTLIAALCKKGYYSKGSNYKGIKSFSREQIV
jgi:hypothetical protein